MTLSTFTDPCPRPPMVLAVDRVRPTQRLWPLRFSGWTAPTVS